MEKREEKRYQYKEAGQEKIQEHEDREKFFEKGNYIYPNISLNILIIYLCFDCNIVTNKEKLSYHSQLVKSMKPNNVRKDSRNI